MKQCCALFLSLFFFTNCNLPERYLEREDYDKAFRYASNRLDWKNQKTRHLQTLETAFAAANERDLAAISELKKTDTRQSWERIHARHVNLLARHEKVRSLFPLASEDGYRPVVRTYPVEAWEAESYGRVVWHSLREIRERLDLAQAGKKLQAREAFNMLERLEKRYNWSSPQAQPLADSCFQLGTAYFLLGVEYHQRAYNGGQVARWLEDWQIGFRDDWRVLHYSAQPGVEYDFFANVYVSNIYVSRGVVKTDAHTNCKDVEVGKKEVKDTSGKVTYEPIYQEVCATMTEVELQKDASVEAFLTLRDGRTEGLLLDEKLWGFDRFCESDCTYSGDSRAVDEIGCSTGCPSYGFPSDWEMLRNSTRSLNRNVYLKLRRMDVLE